MSRPVSATAAVGIGFEAGVTSKYFTGAFISRQSSFLWIFRLALKPMIWMTSTFKIVKTTITTPEAV